MHAFIPGRRGDEARKILNGSRRHAMIDVPADIAISDARRMKPEIAEAILRSGKSLADLPVIEGGAERNLFAAASVAAHRRYGD
jgi:hypothetical protein